MIELRDLTLAAGTFRLSVTLTVGSDEYFVLLGMTGSGKTLLLESFCGLRPLFSGSILINGIDITNAEPRERHIGYVPQEGALFIHLSVDENIAFGLKLGKKNKKDIVEMVLQTARKLGITHLLGRSIKGLSGGERQRVALARAIICEPSVLLLDEPVCALDEFTRETVCRELQMLQRELKIPVIHVCHSFEEASLLADKIGIMQNGKIVQTGTIHEVQQFPIDHYVARLLKLENIFTGEVQPSGQIQCNGTLLKAEVCSGTVDFVIRPWQIEINDSPQNESLNYLNGKIYHMYNIGPAYKVHIDSTIPLIFYMHRLEVEQRELCTGKEITVSFPVDAIHVFNTTKET